MKTTKIHRRLRRNLFKWFRRELVVMFTLSFFLAGTAFANPYGAQVVSGNVNINTQGNKLNITNSPNSIINWQGFSINPNEITRFIQQNSASAVLNRVVGQNPSAILGALQSNGRVFLINPNGVLFGQGARIEVNGLVASTLNLSNADFLSGKYNFTGGSNPGAIKNQGTITTPAGGQVYLIAPDIENTGIINSPRGDILLAAGHSVQLVDSADPFISVVVSAPIDKAVNLGQIVAASGRVGIYGGLIRQGGLVSASSAVVGEDGKIFFKATKDINIDKESITSANGVQGGEITVQSEAGDTIVSGIVTATGNVSSPLTGEGQGGGDGKGGSIQLLGNHVGLIGNVLVDASGKTGGGTVLVGGDYQGKNPDIQNAQAVYVGKDAVIKADAGVNGDGGKVIFWSDEATRVYGAVSAKGGALSGNGGFIETSGHYLDVNGIQVDARAANGNGGTWLLDPYNIEIGAATITATSSGDPIITWTATASSSSIEAATIISALNNTKSVIVDTTGAGTTDDGNITLSSGITGLVQAGGSTLTLKANNNININASITGNLNNLVLIANQDSTGGGDVFINQPVEATVLSATGNNISIANTVTSDNITLTAATGSVSVNNAITLTPSQLTITAATGIFGSTAADPLQTGHAGTPLKLNVHNTGTGPILIADSSPDGLTIAGAKQDTSGQPITISSANVLSFFDAASDITTAGGAVNLTSSSDMTFVSGADITTAGGQVKLETTGAGSNISHVAGANINSSGGAITLKSDNMGLNGAINAGSGKGSLRPTTPNTLVDVGGTDGEGQLGLGISELNTITAGTLSIGDSTAGNLSITAALNAGVEGNGALAHIGNGTTTGALSLASGGAVTQSAGATIAALPVGLNAYGSSVDLTKDNAIGLIAGGTASGNFAFRSVNQVTLTTVDGKSGIVAAGEVGLSSDTGINQLSGAIITATQLNLNLTTLKGSGSANLTESNSISNLGAITAPGGFSLVNSKGLTATGAISTNNNPVSINVGAWTYGQNNVDIVAGSGAINITADDISLAANTDHNAFQTSGGLSIKPATVSQAISLGGGAGLALSTAEITDLAGGVTGGGISIGDYTNGTGAVSIGDNISFGTRNVSLSGGSFSDSGSKVITAGGLALNAKSANIGSSTDAIDAAVSNLIVNTAGGNAYLKTSGNLVLTTVNVGTGIFDLYATGNISQTGIITAGGLSITDISSTGSMVFDQNNMVAKLAVNANAGSGLLFKNGTDLIVGTVNGISGIDVGGANVLLHATGNITLDQPVQSSASGTAVVLNAGNNFINNVGSGAISLSSCEVSGCNRWIVYSANPASNTFGNLDSGNSAVWYTTYAGTLLAGIPAGNRYVFSYQPTVTFTSTSLTKTYGNDAAAAVASAYTVSGLHPGVAGAFLADTNATAFSGIPSVTSAGSPTTAGVGSYAIDVAQGGLGALNGYALAYASSGLLTVDPAILTIIASLTGTASKTYDGTLTAILEPGNFLLSGFAGGDSATVTKTTGTYAAKNVGSSILVSTTLTSSDFSPVGSTSLSNYTLPTSAAGNIGTISPATLSVTGITAQNKIYDATTASVINTGSATLTGIFGSDNVSFSVGSGTFVDKNVGNGKPVTVSGVAISGMDAGNYTLTAPTGISADITPAALTIAGLTASNKVYDGTTAATINTGSATLSGIFSGDAVTLNIGSGAFADRNVGANKVVTVSGINLSGTDAGNYVLGTLPSTVADISKAALTIAAAPNTKTYDGTTSSAAVPIITGGAIMSGDTINLAEAYADKNAGSGKTLSLSVTINDGNGGNNYNVTASNDNTGIINKASLTIAATSNTKVYDGTVSAAAVPTASGLQTGDTITGLAETYTDKNAGSNKAILLSSGFAVNDGNGGNNYNVTTVNETIGVINKAPLTIIADDKTRIYGDANPAFTGYLAGFVGGENLSNSRVTGSANFTTTASESSNIGTYKIIPNAGTLLADNYSFDSFINGNLIIGKALLSIIADDNTKFFGAPNPVFTASYSGFKLGQNESVLGGNLSLITEATTTSPVGAYKITPSGRISDNYAIAFVDGSLMVKPEESVVQQNIVVVTTTSDSGQKTETVLSANTGSGSDKDKDEDKDKDKDKKGDSSTTKEGKDSGTKKQSLPYCN